MSTELQHLIEGVGKTLDRSVALDDPHLRLIAHSAHVAGVDPARTGSILKRSVSSQIVDYVYRQGAGSAHDVFTVSACPSLGLTYARVGAPIRHRGRLLGFVWLLGSDGDVGDDDRDALRRAAEVAGLLMHRESLLLEVAHSRERELTRDLLGDDPNIRARAAEEVAAERLFAAASAFAVVVSIDCGDSRWDERAGLALAAAGDLFRTRAAHGRSLQVERGDHVVIILSEHDPAIAHGLTRLTAEAIDRVQGEAQGKVKCWIGLGNSRSNLDEIYESYLEAQHAAEVASSVRILGEVVHYDELGVYSLLAELDRTKLMDSIHPAVRHLLEDPTASNTSLLRTVEVFLDNAGDIRRTAGQLQIHRTTLYYRLNRVEDVSGLDLSDGGDRLAAHLGLKICRLLGKYG